MLVVFLPVRKGRRLVLTGLSASNTRPHKTDPKNSSYMSGNGVETPPCTGSHDMLQPFPRTKVHAC